MAAVSVIIPCYNQGKWIHEALDSLYIQTFKDFEIIVVNDGSTEPVTQKILGELESESRVRLITTENQGLAEARNTAIRESSGEFVFPLDADDKVAPTMLEKTVEYMRSHADVGIIYTQARLFGEQNEAWELPEYRFPDILAGPMIYASALFRRRDWEQVGGYRSDMIYGWEDYDFWLSLISMGVEVYQIPEPLFYYRKTRGGMAGLSHEKMLYSFGKLFEHHRQLYLDNMKFIFDRMLLGNTQLKPPSNTAECEVYLPDREGYQTHRSLKQTYPKDQWAELRFDLNTDASKSIHCLRIDPCFEMGVVEISAIRLISATTGGVLYEASQPEHFDAIVVRGTAARLAFNEHLRLLSYGNDAEVYLPRFDEDGFQKPLILELTIRFATSTDILGEAVEKLIEFESFIKSSEQLEAEKAAAEQTVQALAEENRKQTERSEALQKQVEQTHAELVAAHKEMELIRKNLEAVRGEYRYIKEKFDASETERRETLEAIRQRLKD